MKLSSNLEVPDTGLMQWMPGALLPTKSTAGSVIKNLATI